MEENTITKQTLLVYNDLTADEREIALTDLSVSGLLNIENDYYELMREWVKEGMPKEIISTERGNEINIERFLELNNIPFLKRKSGYVLGPGPYNEIHQSGFAIKNGI